MLARRRCAARMLDPEVPADIQELEALGLYKSFKVLQVFCRMCGVAMFYSAVGAVRAKDSSMVRSIVDV